MKTLMDTLYIAWIIGTKDILDALKNKSSQDQYHHHDWDGSVLLLVRQPASFRQGCQRGRVR